MPSSKELLEQARVLTDWLLGTADWRPYRGNLEIEQCSHPDRVQHIRPVISALNVEVSFVYPVAFAKLIWACTDGRQDRVPPAMSWSMRQTS